VAAEVLQVTRENKIAFALIAIAALQAVALIVWGAP
jgi:hypothetical protein